MYTNIDPDEGTDILSKYMRTYGKEAMDYIDEKLISKLLKLVMNNNVFKFGDTWWHQNIGMAMGTPCACIYETIFFAWFERQHIFTKYTENFILYCRQIDDIFGIWKTNPAKPNEWENFKSDLNSYCKLKWNTEELSNSVTFLDLTISLDSKGKTISYRTFQKPLNLFLYIPGHSAHPPGVLKSLIFGLVSTYKRQNSNTIDFQDNVKKLFRQLLSRGHTYKNIYPIFMEAAKCVDAKLSKQHRHPSETN
jgi:hypothetical protein